MITHEQLDDVIGSTAYDSDGDKIGKVGTVYYDDDTDQPKWLTVHTGLFGGNETFVPVQGSDLAGDGRVTTTYDKTTVKNAPNVSEDGHLSPQEEEELYRHYNLTDGAQATTERSGTERSGTERSGTERSGTEGAPAASMATGHQAQAYESVESTDSVSGTRASTADDDRRDRAGDAGIVGRDTTGPTTDEAMTRSEEQLRVGTVQREAGKARLRKHIVTENVSTTVPVSHEEVTLEREPITEANRGDALAGADLSEETHEVTLTEQRAVVDKDVVAVERVKLGTQTVTGEEQVDETVRKEVIDTEGVDEARGDVARGDVARGDVARGDVARGDVADREER